MNAHDLQDPAIERIRRRFLSLTGIGSVEVNREEAGPEVFLRFSVGRNAPLYRRALAEIDQELPTADPFHGRLSLRVQPANEVLYSREIELLRSLIARSLRVTSDNADTGPIVEFVPFRGGEEHRAAQPADHAIQGRRGVGKSSLISMAYRRILSDGNVPVWLDLQAYRARSDPGAALEIIRELLQEAEASAQAHYSGLPTDAIQDAIRHVNGRLKGNPQEIPIDTVRQLVPQLRLRVREFTRATQKQLFVFLDDAHLLGPNMQPEFFDIVHSVLKGAGAWLKIAGIKNLLRLYEPSTKVGLQPPNDVQLITLDLTLVDPAAAQDHLTAVLQRFLSPCGVRRSSEIVHKRAIERLVWCSAGVPRDFLWLFDRSIALAVRQRRKRVGVQEINLAVGEFGQEKMSELEQDTTDEGGSLREALDRLQTTALAQHKSNAFLVRLDTKHDGYRALEKLVDLRLVHLIHPGITPSRAGVRYEAYLLDYSFYTGVRRRHGLSELKIRANEPPRYATLRGLPRIALDSICPIDE